MDRKSFWYIHDLIKGNIIFKSTGKRPQRPVKYQLAVFLIRFGGMTGTKAALTGAVAEGSVWKYSKRVCIAIREMRDAHLSWPGEERRDFLSREMAEYGFPGCLGSCDGTTIRLEEKPRKDPTNYYCRKKFYAVSCSLIFETSGLTTHVLYLA